MINYKYVLAATTAFLLPAAVKAENCGTIPSCESLGFTQTAADCVLKVKLLCPFDKTKMFCGYIHCVEGMVESGDWCVRAYKNCAEAGYIEPNERSVGVNGEYNSACESGDEILVPDGNNHYMSCFLPLCAGSSGSGSSSGGSGSGSSSGGNGNGGAATGGGTSGWEPITGDGNTCRNVETGAIMHSCNTIMDIPAIFRQDERLFTSIGVSLDNISEEECRTQYVELLESDFNSEDDFVIYQA